MQEGEENADAEDGKETANFCEAVEDAVGVARGPSVDFFEEKEDIGINGGVLVAEDDFRTRALYNSRSFPSFVPNGIVVV